MGLIIAVAKLTNCGVYLNGASQIGRADEVMVPQIKMKTVDHKGLGMFGTVEVPVGADKLTAKIKWNCLYPDTLIAIASPFSSNLVQVRGSIDVQTTAGRTAQIPAMSLLGMRTKDLGDLTFKQHEDVDEPSEYSVDSVELWIGGIQIYKFNPWSNTFTVGGVDQLAQFNANLGG